MKRQSELIDGVYYVFGLGKQKKKLHVFVLFGASCLIIINGDGKWECWVIGKKEVGNKQRPSSRSGKSKDVSSDQITLWPLEYLLRRAGRVLFMAG